MRVSVALRQFHSPPPPPPPPVILVMQMKLFFLTNFWNVYALANLAFMTASYLAYMFVLSEWLWLAPVSHMAVYNMLSDRYGLLGVRVRRRLLGVRVRERGTGVRVPKPSPNHT